MSAEGGGETLPLPGTAVCISVCERWNGCGDTGERREREEVRATLQCSGGCLAREHAEQRDILPDLLEQDVRSDGTGKQRGDL